MDYCPQQCLLAPFQQIYLTNFGTSFTTHTVPQNVTRGYINPKILITPLAALFCAPILKMVVGTAHYCYGYWSKLASNLTLVLRFYFYAHVLRLGVKKAPTSLSRRTTNLFVSNCNWGSRPWRVQRK